MDRRQILKGLGIGAAGAAAGGFSKQLPGAAEAPRGRPAIGAGGPDPKLSPVEEYDPVTRMVKLHEQGWVTAEEAFSILTGVPKPEPPPPAAPLPYPYVYSAPAVLTGYGFAATMATYTLTNTSATTAFWNAPSASYSPVVVGGVDGSGNAPNVYVDDWAYEMNVQKAPELPAPKVERTVTKRGRA